MIRSMTGFGKGEARDGAKTVVVQLRSVNSRFLELGLKLPSGLWSREADVRALLQAALNRGKLDLHLNEAEEGDAVFGAAVDFSRARAWRDSVGALAADLGLDPARGVETYLRLPGVVAQDAPAPAKGEESAEEGARWALLKAALEAALAGLVESRVREGAALERELDLLLKDAEARVDEIEGLSAALQGSFALRLRKRLAQVLESVSPDDPRLVQEAALAADKADIREEVVRFRAHGAEFRRLLSSDGPSGKRLDFLCQELLREANTMGSKSPASDLTQAVVALKSVVERLKEQALNVE